mmetsp:Transcript_7512/g.18489  ORF Transcript_7512/g.18489 Transcript_7512/m.18489 type:complete len:1412 (-) Transcript_7512:120-4355(-)
MILIKIDKTKRMSTLLFLLILFVLTTSIIASSGRHDIRKATGFLLEEKSQRDRNFDERKLSVQADIDERKLSLYALYNLDKFSVRFVTGRTAELDRVRNSATLNKDASDGDLGEGWMLVSETGGLQSSLSYPIRSVTQDFLYLAFQNLVDDWLLELSGGPDGNNDVSHHSTNTNNNGDKNNRWLATGTKHRSVQVVDIAGGDSTGEEDYNADRRQKNDNTAAATDLNAVEEMPSDELLTAQNQQQSESLETEATSAKIPTDDLDSPQEEQENRSPQPKSSSDSGTTIPSMTNQELESQQIEATQLPTSTDYVYSTQDELQEESSQIQSDPTRDSSQVQGSNQYVDLYDGLVYHNMYGHLVTVDLRVKLYLRKDGYSYDEDSLRRNVRMLQTEFSGEEELLAEMTPTIAFLEPVAQEDKLTKPTNVDVKQIFEVWMQYLFGRQRDVYIRTLREYRDQEMLQDISRLRVDVGVSTLPSTGASTFARNSFAEAWSEQTQKVLIILLVVIGTFAVIWPMFTWAQHIKKNRALSLQMMHGELSLDGSERDDFSDSFSSVTYRDNIHDMVKLPPINPTVQPPNASLPRPQAMSMIHRVSSLDDARHGKDTFPSKNRSDSLKTALSVLEASDRYLSRNRPDLFYDQPAPESKSIVNVFGRVYEIPSNPFEFIYNAGQQQPPSRPVENQPAASTGMDLGRAAHFPFGSPRSSFTARGASTGSNPYPGRSTSVGSNAFPGRSTSVGSVGNSSASSANHFTPIVVPNQNLAAGMNHEFDEERDITNRITAAQGVAAHTGHSWIDNSVAAPSSRYPQPPYDDGTNSGGILGNIFRNLSMASWYSGNTLNNSYTSNPHLDPEFQPTTSSETTEVYYDNYHYQHQDPSLLQSEIELESLPNDEEDPENYDFAFKDFPRKDGTPCLIIDDDSLLSERKRRESAKAIFNIGDRSDNGNTSDGSISEKKVDELPSSNEAFKLMLSQNALEIDNSILNAEGGYGDESMELPPLEGSFLSKDPHDAKSAEFQRKLTRLMETKRQRYTRENKNAAIVAANRKKRKNVRERERVDRHKAIERELEDIEAEFSLTMQPMSPDRNKNHNSSGSINFNARTTPKRNAASPKSSAGRFSPMPSRRAPSPARKNIATLSPPRPSSSNISVSSPARSNIIRRGGSHMRQNSLGSSHQRQNSLGSSPYRKFSPRTRYPNSDISRGVSRSLSASQRSISPPDNTSDFDVTMPAYKSKSRATNLHGADQLFTSSTVSGGAQYNDLSLPSMNTAGEKSLEFLDAKFPSPQAVIDEALQSGSQMQRQFTQSKRHHQRSLTPSRMRVSQASPAQQNYMSRRTNSLDLNDDSYHRRIHSASSYSATSSQLPQHSLIRHSPSAISNSNSGHRRTVSSGMGSNHKRSNSRDEDIFLHGVVAQTRFI